MSKKRKEESEASPATVYSEIKGIAESAPVIDIWDSLVGPNRLRNKAFTELAPLRIGPDFLRSLGPLGNLVTFVEDLTLIRHVPKGRIPLEIVTIVDKEVVDKEVRGLLIDELRRPLLLALSGREGTFSGARMRVLSADEGTQATPRKELSGTDVGSIEYRWRRHELDRKGEASLVLEPKWVINQPFSGDSSPEGTFMVMVIGRFLSRVDVYQADMSKEERMKTLSFMEILLRASDRFKDL